MNERKECKKLDGKDLINIGIFTAIYFVVVFAVAMLGMIPIFFDPAYCFCTAGRRYYF